MQNLEWNAADMWQEI